MASAARASDVSEDPAALPGARVLGRLTLPGRPEQVREARLFVSATLLGTTAAGLPAPPQPAPGQPEPLRLTPGQPAADLQWRREHCDVAVLLTSELVTNAVMHSNSRGAGGTVTVVIAEISVRRLRIEVTDCGTNRSAPVVKGKVLSDDGHGLLLVQNLADNWGYLRHALGTTVWFTLGTQPV